jgi:hypothetical protein
MTHMPQRLPDWMIRLDELVRARSQAPYTWGEFDCCTLGADVVLSITGRDLMADVRGSYATEAEAYGLLELRGGLVAILTSALGRPVPVAFAQVGDLGISNAGALVFFGGVTWLGQGDVGLVYVDAPSLAWRCSDV